MKFLRHALLIGVAFGWVAACGGGTSSTTEGNTEGAGAGATDGPSSSDSMTTSPAGGDPVAGSSGSTTTTSSASSTGGGGAGGEGGGQAGGGGSGDGGAGGGITSGGGGAGGGDPTCGCFDTGGWSISNLSPCFITTTMSGVTTTKMVSTSQVGTMAQCPSSAAMTPTAPWSTDKFRGACAGTYKLCVTLKAGDWHAPQAGDCALVKDCVNVTYTTAGMQQAVDPLPGWLSTATPACITQFSDDGGYGVLTVEGDADGCGTIATHQLEIVSYCPLACDGANPPASCAACEMP